MERYLDITMAYTEPSRGFLQHLRQVIDWGKRNYELEDYRLVRMGMKRIDGNVHCRIVFTPKH
ncbi:MAG TPA: hypothetical protein VHR47_00360 [Bacillota bacterium]|jgi:hypothetical protein|nr:hypothetical protein [Bacillota bacterium]